MRILFREILARASALNARQLEASPDSAEKSEEIMTAAERARVIASAYVSVLSPVEGQDHSSQKDTAYIRSYKGKEGIECMFSKPLKSGFYGSLADEQLAKAGSAKLATPVLQKLLQAAGAGFDKSGMEEALDRLPVLRRDLRKGATQELERLMLQWLTEKADEAMASNPAEDSDDGDGDQELPSSKMELAIIGVVLTGLEVFAECEGIADRLQNLRRWTVENKKVLDMCRFEQKMLEVALAGDLAECPVADLAQLLPGVQDEDLQWPGEKRAIALKAATKIFGNFKLRAA